MTEDELISKVALLWVENGGDDRQQKELDESIQPEMTLNVGEGIAKEGQPHSAPTLAGTIDLDKYEVETYDAGSRGGDYGRWSQQGHPGGASRSGSGDPVHAEWHAGRQFAAGDQRVLEDTKLFHCSEEPGDFGVHIGDLSVVSVNSLQCLRQQSVQRSGARYDDLA